VKKLLGANCHWYEQIHNCKEFRESACTGGGCVVGAVATAWVIGVLVYMATKQLLSRHGIAFIGELLGPNPLVQLGNFCSPGQGNKLIQPHLDTMSYHFQANVTLHGQREAPLSHHFNIDQKSAFGFIKVLDMKEKISR